MCRAHRLFERLELGQRDARILRALLVVGHLLVDRVLDMPVRARSRSRSRSLGLGSELGVGVGGGAPEVSHVQRRTGRRREEPLVASGKR